MALWERMDQNGVIMITIKRILIKSNKESSLSDQKYKLED